MDKASSAQKTVQINTIGMKIFVLFILTFLRYNSYSQQRIFYINIPPVLKSGTIIYDLHADPKDSIFTITFSGFSIKKEPAGLLILCYKTFQKGQKNSLGNGDILTPEMTMDSLAKNGRPFLRKNIFYALFIVGNNYYIHRIKRSQYLYMSYENE